jgi:guanylate kinase
MAKASDEMSHYTEYDYIVVNEQVEKSVSRVTSILQAERLRRSRQTGLHAFVSQLVEDTAKG